MSGQKIVRIQECLSAKTPYERLSILRRVLRLSREELLGEYEIPKATLLSWEHGIKNISDQNLHKLLDIYLQEGLLASADWVREGVGSPPIWVKDLGAENKLAQKSQEAQEAQEVRGLKNKKNLKAEIISDDIFFSQEALFFRGLSENSVASMVETDDMAPYCYKGDMVGGRFCSGKALKQCLNRPCIVRVKGFTKDCIRILVPVSGELDKADKADKAGNLFNLICMNPAGVKEMPAVLVNVEVEMAAPIIWRRSRE